MRNHYAMDLWRAPLSISTGFPGPACLRSARRFEVRCAASAVGKPVASRTGIWPGLGRVKRKGKSACGMPLLPGCCSGSTPYGIAREAGGFLRIWISLMRKQRLYLQAKECVGRKRLDDLLVSGGATVLWVDAGPGIRNNRRTRRDTHLDPAEVLAEP